MISELISNPIYDNNYEETTFKVNNKNESNEEILDYNFKGFPNCSKSENETEENNERYIMLIEGTKIEHNISQKITNESNNKSEIISLKEENKNEDKYFWDLKSISIYKSEKSNLDFTLTANNEYLFNKHNIKIVELKQNENKENKEKINDKKNKKNKIFYISKNKNIFKVVNPNKFFIFHCGNKDKNTRIFINEILKKKKFIILENMSIKIIIKQNRKYDADNIRKKIKARFLKYLKNAINERLIGAGSEYCFSFLPQNFICNIRKNINRGVLNLTLEEVFSKNFCENEKEETSSLEKYKHNLIVLDYLKYNQIISETSNFNKFKDMKYYEIYHEYLRSNEFEKEVNRIRKKENIEYTKLYIQLSNNLINFFLKV